jgi:hypothetical protein
MNSHHVHTLIGLSFFILLGLITLLKSIMLEQKSFYLPSEWTGHGQEEEADQINAMMKDMRIRDKKLVSAIMNVSLDSINESDAKAHFYQAISMPLQGVCLSLKRIGGMWVDIGRVKAVDGDKFICMDGFSTRGDCLIYSFGIR